MIDKTTLTKLYVDQRLSAKQIALQFLCSENKIHYWLKKYEIEKRTISNATYYRANPNGDPFALKKPNSLQQAFLFGLGLGLYWGEGNKANTHAVRLGNTDPQLIKWFIKFLSETYQIDKSKLRFGIQLFTDTSARDAIKFWTKTLEISPQQFHKTVITKQGKPGTYRKKLQYGVLTVYFSNIKLRDMIVHAITELQQGKMPM